jgi:chemotaxis protein methyltransferase CheR
MHTGSQREFAFQESDFQKIVALVRERAGIVLGERKRDLVYGRLARRLRKLGFKAFSDYCAHLESPEGAPECRMMVNAITTNLTGFFREPHHFEFLANELLPALVRSRSAMDRRLRIWSAGCSSGEEPYSIAMIVRNALGDDGRWDAKILATDIDTQMVATAEAGCYAADRVASIPPAMQRQFVRQVDEQTVAMADALKSMIVFKPLNLFDDWPMQGPFDAIFCRNVIIYFDMDAKRILFDRFADILTPGGWMFIGHSESLFRVTERFRHIGRTIHRRVS